MKTGDVVLLKDQELLPRSWPLARIIETYPGKDGQTRVVKVKTQHGEYVRPIVRLVLLLPEEADHQPSPEEEG